eukprot:2835891-Pleurochrysis_carterae.AAC.1
MSAHARAKQSADPIHSEVTRLFAFPEGLEPAPPLHRRTLLHAPLPLLNEPGSILNVTMTRSALRRLAQVLERLGIPAPWDRSLVLS